MNSDLVALVSVLLTGSVAIWTSIFQPIVTRRIEKERRLEERRSTVMAQIHADSTALLGHLAFFSSGSPDVATQRPTLTVYSDLLTRYYTWELTVWPYLDGMDLETIKGARAKIEDAPKATHIEKRGQEFPTLLEDANKLAQIVTILSRTAIDAVP